MRTLGILLLLLFVCVAFRPACSHGEGDSQLRIAAKVGNIRPPYGLTISRQKRTVRLITDIASVVQDILQIPIRLFTLITTGIRQILVTIRLAIRNAITFVIRLLLYPAGRVFNSIVRTKRASPFNLLELLLSDLSRIIFHPLETIENAIDATRDFARAEMANAMHEAVRLGWRFLSTTGLPFLRRTLDRIAKLPNVPDSVRTSIKNFDRIYTVLQMFGYVSPAY